MSESQVVNVLMAGADSLYFHGMYFLFEELFKHDAHRPVFLQGLSERNVIDADIIVLQLFPGEYGVCLPELRKRTKGIVLGLTDKFPDRRLANPSCYHDVILINRSATTAEIKKIIRRTWNQYCERGKKAIKHSCFYCRNKTLSVQQARTVALIYKGMPVSEIADTLAVTVKTVLAHKYVIMKKFELDNDYELISFLNRMAGRNIQYNFFRNLLNML